MRKKRSMFMKSMASCMVIFMAVLTLRQDGRAMIIPAEMTSPAAEADGFTNRQEDMAKIRVVLENKMVRQKLVDTGYTEEEINQRLQQLSDQDVHQLASQMNSMMPAGDAGGALIAVLVIVILVLLIIYLVKRV